MFIGLSQWHRRQITIHNYRVMLHLLLCHYEYTTPPPFLGPGNFDLILYFVYENIVYFPYCTQRIELKTVTYVPLPDMCHINYYPLFLYTLIKKQRDYRRGIFAEDPGDNDLCKSSQ